MAVPSMTCPQNYTVWYFGVMRPSLVFLAVAMIMATVPTLAQPYVDKIHAAVADPDVIYGTAVAFNGRVDTLRMNIWVPANDNATSRPCVVWVHGGGFTNGHRREMDAACADWAERGYVAVTISYRLGFYGPFPLDPPFAYDQAEVMRACFRGVQDLRSALRFLVEHADRYGIDTARFIVGGASAGAIIALHAAYVDDRDARPDALGSIAAVQRGFDVFPRPDLGSLDGTSASGAPLPRLRGVVNIFGAITDLAILNGAPFVPTWSYHQRADPVVPCDTRRALWGLPLGVGDNYPILHGSCTLDATFAERGFPASSYETVLYDGADHDIHDRVGLDRTAALFCARQIAATVSVSSEDNDPTYDPAPWEVYDLRGRHLGSISHPGGNTLLSDGVYLLTRSTSCRPAIVRQGTLRF